MTTKTIVIREPKIRQKFAAAEEAGDLEAMVEISTDDELLEDEWRAASQEARAGVERLIEQKRAVHGEKDWLSLVIREGLVLVKTSLEVDVQMLLRLIACDHQRIRDLEEKLAGLQAPTLRYVGTWKGGTEYRRGNFVTHAGSLWHANTDTSEIPGKSNDWTLAVKSGRP